MKMTIRLKEDQVLPKISKESIRVSYGRSERIQGVILHMVERRGGREGYSNEKGEWVGWAKPGDLAPARRIPNWVPICCRKYCKQCGFYKCKGCHQNPVQPVCEHCHAPHLRHECPHSVDNPVQVKKREAEYKKLQEENNWERGEGLTEEMITELKDGRFKHMSPKEISEMMRVRKQKANEEHLINLE